jgi:hypothetical protein
VTSRKTVLDLPEERQRELAKLEGLSLSTWQEYVRAGLSVADETRAARGGTDRLTTAARSHWQNKVNSGNPPG